MGYSQKIELLQMLAVILAIYIPILIFLPWKKIRESHELDRLNMSNLAGFQWGADDYDGNSLTAQMRRDPLLAERMAVDGASAFARPFQPPEYH
jgi:hypothetical protein